MSAQVVQRYQSVGRVGIPMGGRHKARIRTYSAAILAAVFAVQVFAVAETQAQRREILIGIASRDEPRSTVGDVSTASDLGLQSAAPQLDREREASRRLQYARDDLAAGNLTTARAQLDNLIHRFTGTAASDEARKILARMQGTIAESRIDLPVGPAETANRRTSRASNTAGGGQRDPVGDSRVSQAQRVELDRSFRHATGDRIFFANGSAELGARALDVIAAQIRWLARHPEATVTLEAHADDVGSAAYNTALSRQRGEAVRHQFLSAGIAAERVRIRAHGRENQIAPCPQEACAAQNRRVLTTISASGGEASPSMRTGLANPRRD